MCLVVCLLAQWSIESYWTVQRSSPSPTRNCHSGPVGFEIVLFVSIMGTMPVIPVAPYGPPIGYRGGGGRTLVVVSKRA